MLAMDVPSLYIVYDFTALFVPEEEAPQDNVIVKLLSLCAPTEREVFYVPFFEDVILTLLGVSGAL